MQQTPRRIHLLSNSKSGTGRGEALPTIAERICRELGATLICYEIKSPADLDAKGEIAAEAAAKQSNDVLIAAGGDGTVRSVAEKALAAGVRLAIVPCGTFNFFARAHQIPEDHEQALRLAILGDAKAVRLGEMNGRTFLINASLGLYAASIKERESMTKRFGRKRFIVILSTINTLLRRHRLLQVRLNSEGVERQIRTPMIFIGNNALQLRNLSLSVADCFQAGLLAVVALKPVRGWEMIRVILRGIARTLENEERLEQFCTETLLIGTNHVRQMVALDGETFMMNSPFVVRALPGAMQLIVPPATLDTKVST